MPDDPYHSLPAYCNSGRKTFRRCQFAWLLGKRGVWKQPATEPMDVGTFFHLLKLEPEKAAAWLAEHPQYTYKTSKKGEYQKGDPLAKFAHCHAMVRAIERQPLAMERLEGEHEVVLTGEMNGVPVRCKVDAIDHARCQFSDLKSCKALDGEEWIDKTILPWHDTHSYRSHGYVSWIEAYQYHWQMAMYRDILRQHYEGFSTAEPAIVACTKQDPPGVGIYRFTDEDKLSEALKDAYATVQQMHEMMQDDDPRPTHCGVCELCRVQPITRCMEV